MEDKKDVLMKNNMLIKARYDINVYENKLFILLLHKLQKINETTCVCVMKTDEIKKVLNARAVRSKKEIARVFSDLRKCTIFFKKENSWGEFGFINGYEYDEKKDAFIVEASEKVHSMLRDYMKDGYTPINMQIWLSLRGSYAQRFYDFLRLWSGTKTIITYKIDELKELLMLEDKYPRYAEFKRRVVQPAITELNKTGYFNIEISENKVGRKVESIDFIVKDLDDRIYFKKTCVVVTDEAIAVSSDKAEEIIDIDKEITKKVKKKNVEDFYIPNKKMFDKEVLINIKKDFNQYDFKDPKIKKIFRDLIGVTLDKDDEEMIMSKAYAYFKASLEDQLGKTNNSSNGIGYKKNPLTRFHNINQSFNKYSPEELEKQLFASQKAKGMQNTYTPKTKFHNFEESFTNYSDEEFEDIVAMSQEIKFGK